MKLLDDELLEKCIETWGAKSQSYVAIGEAAEYIDAIVKFGRGQEVLPTELIGEIADNFIMCQQMACIFGKEQVNKRIAEKEQDIIKRLEKYNEK